MNVPFLEVKKEYWLSQRESSRKSHILCYDTGTVYFFLEK